MGVGQAAVRQRELRVLDDRLLEEVERLVQPFVGALVQVIPALQIEIARGEVFGRAPRAARVSGVEQAWLQFLDDRVGDRFLRRERIVERGIDRLGPEIRRRRGVHEVHGDAHAIAGLPDAAGQHHAACPAAPARRAARPSRGRDRENPERLEFGRLWMIS